MPEVNENHTIDFKSLSNKSRMSLLCTKCTTAADNIYETSLSSQFVQQQQKKSTNTGFVHVGKFLSPRE